MTTRRMDRRAGARGISWRAQWTVDGEIRGAYHSPRFSASSGHGKRRRRRPGPQAAQRPATGPAALSPGPQRAGHGCTRPLATARVHRRRSTFRVAPPQWGPGAANMLTGAGPWRRLTGWPGPCCCRSDAFATRVSDPVLQQLEHPHDTGIQVTDAFPAAVPLLRPGCVASPSSCTQSPSPPSARSPTPWRPERSTIALPEDVAGGGRPTVPVEFLADREWHIRRPLPEPGPLARAAAAVPRREGTFHRGRRRRRLRGGGKTRCASFAESTGIPVGHQPGRRRLAPLGPTRGTSAASAPPAHRPPNRPGDRGRDLVIGIGTRYSDFTTASRTRVPEPPRDLREHQRRLVRRLQARHPSCPVIADAAGRRSPP